MDEEENCDEETDDSKEVQENTKHNQHIDEDEKWVTNGSHFYSSLYCFYYLLWY